MNTLPVDTILKILIAEDHPFFSEGLLNALTPFEKYKVVGCVVRGDEVLAAIERWNPDIILLDINMPGATGVEILPAIKKFRPLLKIVIITMYMPGDLKFIPEMEPIDAYILKNSGTEVLLAALDSVQQGGRYFDPGIMQSRTTGNDSFTRQNKLSSREKEIVQLLVAGYSNQQIAEKLFLSELTIKTHRKNIMAKMEAHNLADLIFKMRQ